jgi:hypothetical protein
VEARVLVFKGCLVGLLYGFCFVDSKFEVTQINLRRRRRRESSSTVEEEEAGHTVCFLERRNSVSRSKLSICVWLSSIAATMTLSSSSRGLKNKDGWRVRVRAMMGE